ncbi:MAG TPA: DoxX family protein [Cyclobacteriaceae bacterium]|nr:DoxX family protein [Cyclobacteriaceae bacterium]
MKSKPRSVVGWVLTGIAGLLILSSGIFKLSGAPMIVEGMTKLGVGPYIPLLGTMEIVFTVLFVFPKTSKIGFLLVISYFAGALATELSHGNPILTPILILVLVWVAAFLRKPEIFIDQKELIKN